MAILAAVCTLVLAVIVVAVVSAPLRGRAGGHDGTAAEAGLGAAQDAAGPAGLDAAREVTYRELRDAELDYRTGKLSEQDYRAVDAELKAQALALLDQIERREAARENG